MIFNFGIEDDKLDEINAVRRLAGLPPIVKAKRYCMNCNKDFESEGPQNRLCNNCRPRINEGI